MRTWQPERDRRVVLVLDTSRTSAGRVEDVPRLDAAMDAALLLAALAARAGDRVDLLAGDRRVRARVAGAEPATLLGDLVSAMAPLEPALVEADWPTLATEVAAIAPRSARSSSCSPRSSRRPIEECLLPDARRAHAAPPGRARLGQRPRPRRRWPPTRASARQVYDAAAAERTVALRQRTAAAAGSAWACDVIDADRRRTCPSALADHYLLLKSHGLL